MAHHPHSAATGRRRGPALVAAVLLALGAVGIATPAVLPVADASSLAVPGGPDPTDPALGFLAPAGTAPPATRLPAAPPSPTANAPTSSPPTPSPQPEPTATHAAAAGGRDDDGDQGHSGGGTPRPEADVAMERQVVGLVNRRRAEAGCGRLRLDHRLARAALAHSRDMAAHDYFSHTGRDGSSPWDRAARAGYDTPRAENLAAGHRSAAEVVQAWMDSPGHRRNLLDCTSKAVGVGFARGGSYGTYWTQMFGTV